MDPLDQRLTEAGSAWRRAQAEPPDLDRMIVALRRRPSGRFQGRLMFAFVAGLLLLAAVAIAPGVGSFFHRSDQTIPVTPPTASPTPGASTFRSTSPSPLPTPTAPLSDPAAAKDIVNRYETALVAGHWQTAFDLLATTSLTHQSGLDAYTSERAAYFHSVDGRYVVGDPTPVNDWATYAPIVTGADQSRGWLVEVDYPALSGNNAGFEQFVVAPDPTGTWRIWPVR